MSDFGSQTTTDEVLEGVDLSGRRVLITGAAVGLGRETARAMAAHGAEVTILARSAERADEGAAAVEALVPGAGVDTGVVDLGSLASVNAFADGWLADHDAVDVLINNAGVIRWAGFPEADAENLAAHLDVHLWGSFHTTRAAWPTMVEQGFGRVVMTTSSGVFGLPQNLGYAAAKGGVIGLARSLATAGAKRGIKVNCIAPAASTRMAGGGGGPDPALMDPALVAPLAAYLAHEDCPVTGVIYCAGAGRFARLFLASTPGWVAGGEGDEPTLEDVAAHWEAINAEEGYTVPADLVAWSRTFLDHLPPPG